MTADLCWECASYFFQEHTANIKIWKKTIYVAISMPCILVVIPTTILGNCILPLFSESPYGSLGVKIAKYHFALISENNEMSSKRAYINSL